MGKLSALALSTKSLKTYACSSSSIENKLLGWLTRGDVIVGRDDGVGVDGAAVDSGVLTATACGFLAIGLFRADSCPLRTVRACCCACAADDFDGGGGGGGGK